MRKIEQDMNTAIRYRRNMSKQNTSVRCFKTNGVTTDVDVFLHGNHIASLDTATNALTIKTVVGSQSLQNPDLTLF